MSINFDDLESPTGILRREQAEAGHVPARPRAPPPRRYTLISVDDHLVEPPHMFEGRVPDPVRRRCATGRDRRRRAWSTGCTTASATTRSASTPSSVDRIEELQLRARPASTRCAAARGTSTPASTTWTSTASTPRSTSRRRSPGSPGSATSSASAIPSSRSPSCAPRTTGTSRSGPAPYPGRIIPLPAAVAARPRASAPPRSAATPRAGFHAVTFPELPERLGLPSLHTGYWDPFIGGLRGDRDRRLPARRLVVERPDDVVRRARRHHRRAVLRLGHVRRRRLALLQAPGALPGPEDLPVRGRHRLGRRAARPPRPRRALPADVRHVGRHRPHARARCCSATSGSARSTTRPGSSSATASASTTCCSSPTTRTRTARGPTPRRSSTRQIGHFPADDIRKLTWENASKLFDHPVPDAVQTDPEAY